MTAQEITREAARRNIALEPKGDHLIVHFNGAEIPPDFEPILRAKKSALISYLKKERLRVCHIAKQILAGEFSGASALLMSHLHRELGWQKNPLCQRAAEKLRLDYLKAFPPKGNFRNA